MQKSLSIALFILALWAIHNYDVNSACYEIVKVGQPLNSDILLNKCKGKTWALVHDEREVYEYDEEGNETSIKFKTLVWTSIHRGGGSLSYGDVEK